MKMQVSNIEIIVSTDEATQLLADKVEDTGSAVRFTELQCVGGGSGICSW
jgi:hypothetical protein